MNFSLRREAPALALVLLLFAVSAWAWPQVPDRIPMHWGPSGEPDGWGGRHTLFLLPAVAAGVWVLMAVIPRLDPGRTNYANFAGAYAVLRTSIVAFLGLMHGVAVAAALGHTINMNHVVIPATGFLFILLGSVMGKVRPNWFVGVRTPWTLTSKLSWTRTHRVAGWLFTASGVAVLLIGMMSAIGGIVAILVGALGTTLVTFIYSHHVWAHDPDRQPPGGTTPG